MYNSPLAFSKAMTTYWSTPASEGGLGNVANPQLQEVWQTMAATFNAAIEDNLSDEPSGKWRVLQPETGTAKTQGSLLYLARHARYLRDYTHLEVKPGAVFVTRTTEQCNEAVATINKHTGFEAAVTRHTGKDVTGKMDCDIEPEETLKYPILVITQAAYVQSHRRIRGRYLWEWFSRWADGTGEHPRALTIIDEALSNVIEHTTVTPKDLYFVLGQLPSGLGKEHSLALEVIDAAVAYLRKVKDDENTSTRVIWQSGEALILMNVLENNLAVIEEALDDLVAELRRRQKLREQSGRQKPHNRERRLQEIKEVRTILSNLMVMLSEFAFYMASQTTTTFNAGRYLLPRTVPGPVLLDATATTNVLVNLLDDAEVIETPRARSYGNVKVHVARYSGLGKGAMLANLNERAAGLAEIVRSNHRQGDQWLAVCHKDLEAHALKYLPSDGSVATAHYGAVDGKNTWQHANKVVIFGIPYPDPAWSSAAYFAVRGPQADDWFRSETGIKVRSDLEAMLMASSIVQAIMRIRIRRVIDGEGNCKSCEVFILLPPTKTGDAILNSIKAEMPGAHFLPWEVDLSRFKMTKPGEQSVRQTVVTFMQNATPGSTYTVRELSDILDFGKDAYDSFRKKVTKPGTSIRRQLDELGIAVLTEGRGRGAKTFLVKPDPALTLAA